jgi:CD36 family
MLKYQPDINLATPDPRYFTQISGLMNISACTAVGPDGDGAAATGPPVLMSFPHFCYVDPMVAAMTEGTRCNKSRHELWLGVEPATGITMAAAKRLQARAPQRARRALLARSCALRLPLQFTTYCWAACCCESGDARSASLAVLPSLHLPHNAHNSSVSRGAVQFASEVDASWPAFDPNVSRAIIPIFWAEEIGEVGTRDAATFRDRVYPVRHLTMQSEVCM